MWVMTRGKTGSYSITNGVTTIINGAFGSCAGLTSVNIPNSVVDIWMGAFAFCTSLNSVTIGSGIYSIGDYAFGFCTNLTGVYFKGGPPIFGLGVFTNDLNAIVYHMPWASGGWSSTYPGRPIAPWDPQIVPSPASMGVRTNRFGFNVTASSGGMVVVVEACADLANPVWAPVATNTLTSGASCFSDPQWTNYPGRYYRLRSP